MLKTKQTKTSNQTETYISNLIENSWENWLMFKPKLSKEWQLELKKHLPPYFDSTSNKINDFSMRENVLFPPCPQEFLEVLLNGILLRNELGVYSSKYFFYKELQQLLNEFLKLFYYRIDAIIDVFQTITKLSISKDKFPKIVLKCANCGLYVFINYHCETCESQFYCDEMCQKIHKEYHSSECPNNLKRIPKIIDPLRIEVHVSSESLGEEIFIYNEHNMKFSKLMKGKILLAFLFKALRKDRWFRNNKYAIEENIAEHNIVLRRGINVELDIINYENKDFIHKLSAAEFKSYYEDEFRDILKLSVFQELKYNFYKLGALLVDVLKEKHPYNFKYIFIFNFC